MKRIGNIFYIISLCLFLVFWFVEAEWIMWLFFIFLAIGICIDIFHLLKEKKYGSLVCGIIFAIIALYVFYLFRH